MLRFSITSQFHSKNFENFKSVFLLAYGKKKNWKFACLFDLSNGMNQGSFQALLLDNILIKGCCLKNTKLHVH